MITLEQYVSPHKDSSDWTPERRFNAGQLLVACSELQKEAEADGVKFPINSTTGSQISGQTLGGFRPQDCKIGATKSSHKEGLAVDIYDPYGAIDSWCMVNQDKLANHGIYIEHPTKTIGWSHWTIKAPGSKNRVFFP